MDQFLWGFSLSEKKQERLSPQKIQPMEKAKMGVSENSGTPKIIHFNRVFHYKPSILGVPLFFETPKCIPKVFFPNSMTHPKMTTDSGDSGGPLKSATAQCEGRPAVFFFLHGFQGFEWLAGLDVSVIYCT